MRLIAPGAAVLAAVLATGALAADDPADIAFWTSVRGSANPAELQAYIDAFPNGQFIALARIRLRQLTQAGTAAVMPAPPAVPGPAAPTVAPVLAAVVPARTKLRLVDPVVVDVDARGLTSGSNHRLAVVPAGMPDAIADPAAFSRESTTVPPSRTRVSLPLAAPGHNEVRLYYIPQFGSAFVVAARASVEVAPGYPGAVLVGRLLREAGETNPVRFEAKYRDQTINVQGQFLRIQPRSVDALAWSSLLGAVAEEKPYVAMSVGRLGAERRSDGAPTELLCLMPADNRVVLDRVALLNPGDPVVLRGTPSTWRAAFGAVAVIFNPCTFAPTRE